MLVIPTNFVEIFYIDIEKYTLGEIENFKIKSGK